MGKRYPKVVLIGRTNVGKSALFNRLSNTSRSIVFDKEGVTRDYVHEVVNWGGKKFDLIDAGGMPIGKQKDPILQEVQESVMALIEEAELLVFVCDGKVGLVEEDRQLARIIHKSKKAAVLALNKADNTKAFEENEHEFSKLGFGEHIAISALHGIGINTLLEKIVDSIPNKAYEDDKPEHRITIVGKPNVGKSSLMNILMQKPRSIVSDVPGTTREAISENIKFYNTTMALTDTAGIRRKSRVSDELEEIMVKSSLRSLREADIIMLLVDASVGDLVDQELKLLFYAHENNKAVVLVFNKTDLITPEERVRLEDLLTKYKFILDKVYIVWISCKDKKNIAKLSTAINKIRAACTQEFSQEKLDDIVLNQISKKPLYRNEVQLIVKRLKHIPANMPTFIVKVNLPQFFEADQLGFIENVLRRNYDLKGCPVKLIVQKGR